MTLYYPQIALLLTTLTMLIPAFADEFDTLKGVWTCQEEGLQSTLEFQTPSQMIYNGTATSYQATGTVLRVQEEHSTTDYYYQMQNDMLLIFSLDGSMSACERGGQSTRSAQTLPSAAMPKQTQSNGNGWPPPYHRPPGHSSWESSSPQHLLYKFSGRWDHYSGSTLENLYLKPDGTFDDASETSYSGVFTDQGGYQTGAWGAVGTGQGQGRWTIRGNLRQGTIALIRPDGNQRTFNYQVHCKGGECYGSEYFFDNKLYSVNYIYR